MRILLMGTSSFAYLPFEKIIKNFEVVGIVTKPDARAFRGQQIQYSAIKKLALKNNIPCLQSENLQIIYQTVKNWNLDLIITCAYGYYVPTYLRQLPRLQAINIHASLLPKYRGAAPIHAALWNEETQTGISLIYMSKTMDAGQILFQAKLAMSLQDNFLNLSNRLTNLATEKITEWINKLDNQRVFAQDQDEKLISYAPKWNKTDFHIDVDHESVKSAWKKIHFFGEVFPVKMIINQKIYRVLQANLNSSKDSYPVKFKDGILFLEKIQPPNRKIMSVKSFLNAHRF